MTRLLRKPCAMPAQTNIEPPPQNDLVQVCKRQHNVHFSYGILEPCHHLDERSSSTRQRKERYSIVVQASVGMFVPNQHDLRGDVAPKYNQHMDDVHLAHPRASL